MPCPPRGVGQLTLAGGREQIAIAGPPMGPGHGGMPSMPDQAPRGAGPVPPMPIPATTAGLVPAMDAKVLRRRLVLDRLPDRAQDLRRLAAEEDEGDDRHDRDERENECVLGEALALLVANEE
jgi:hypothetical protein